LRENSNIQILIFFEIVVEDMDYVRNNRRVILLLSAVSFTIGFILFDLYSNNSFHIVKIAGLCWMLISAFVSFLSLFGRIEDETKFRWRLVIYVPCLIAVLFIATIFQGQPREFILKQSHDTTKGIATDRYCIFLRSMASIVRRVPVIEGTFTANGRLFKIAQPDLYRIYKGDSIIVEFFPGDPHIANIKDISR
jgi:hypothetical protein